MEYSTKPKREANYNVITENELSILYTGNIGIISSGK